MKPTFLELLNTHRNNMTKDMNVISNIFISESIETNKMFGMSPELSKIYPVEGIFEFTNALTMRCVNHDTDKVLNEETFNAYNKYFVKLKQIPWSREPDSDYVKYEKEHLSKAHYNHNQERHHFYDSRNNTKDVNIIDLTEAVVDMISSTLTYQKEPSFDKAIEDVTGRGLMSLDKEKLIDNAIQSGELDEYSLPLIGHIFGGGETTQDYVTWIVITLFKHHEIDID